MHNWQPGDLGALISVEEGSPYVTLKANGRIVQVQSTAYVGPDGDTLVNIEPFRQGIYEFTSVNVEYLRYIPPEEKYDGHETTTWDECPWQPKELVTTKE